MRDAHSGSQTSYDGERFADSMRYVGTYPRVLPAAASVRHELMGETEMNEQKRETRTAVAGAQQTEVAVLAGGCFWGVEEILRGVPGVIETDVGYTGGWLENPTYDDTHDSKSGHAEAI